MLLISRAKILHLLGFTRELRNTPQSFVDPHPSICLLTYRRCILHRVLVLVVNYSFLKHKLMMCDVFSSFAMSLAPFLLASHVDSARRVSVVSASSSVPQTKYPFMVGISNVAMSDDRSVCV